MRREQGTFERSEEAIERAYLAYERAILRARNTNAPDAIENPLEAFREVAGLKGLETIREEAPSPIFGTELRDARARWVARLAVARVTFPYEARIEARPAPVAEGAETSAGASSTETSYREILSALAHAESPAARRASWSALSERAESLSGDLGELRARRHEAARRAGLVHPDASGVDVPIGEVALGARTFLRSTGPIARDVLARHAARRGLESDPLLVYFDHVVGQDACDPFPPKPKAHWFGDWFQGLGRAYAPNERDMPSEVAGASTFLRALTTFGKTFARARARTSDSSLAFTLRVDPYAFAPHEAGSLFGSLPGQAAFLSGGLGVSTTRSNDVAQRIGAILLHRARHLAACVILTQNEVAARDTFEEVTLSAYGFSLPDRLRLAWPWPREDTFVRFVAAVEAHGLGLALRDRFDEDWFRNPRAARELEARYMVGRAPGGLREADKWHSATVGLARSFEALLG